MGLEVIGMDSPLQWEDFLLQVDMLKKDVEKISIDNPYQYVRGWLFRGQKNADWGLETSLERHLISYGIEFKNYDVDDYINQIKRIIPALNSFTGRRYSANMSSPVSRNMGWNSDFLELIYYLRHHGFPTPILDWTRSFWVATFFAFNESSIENNVAIYAYNDSIVSVRGGWVGEAQMNVLGPYVQTHKRHFLQQSEYTSCISQEGIDENANLFFRRHEDAIADNARDHPLKKFIIDGKEKRRALGFLDDANINAYTLFGTEEGLMSMLALRSMCL